MAKFLWNTAKGDYARNTAETIRLGLEARSLYAEIIREEGLKFDQRECGILHFYKDDKYFQNAVDVKDLYNANGCEWDLLSPMKTKSMDPALGSIKGIVGGVWTPSDWTGDIHKFCHEMERVLTHKYGVEFRYMEIIQSAYDFEILDDCYDAVVVAAGVGSEKLANIVGDSLGIYPVKGYSITITANDITSYEAMPKVSLLDDQAKIVTSTLGNRLRVAGTAELAGENYDIRKDRIQPLLDWVHTNFPNINTRDYTQWACLRPMTPNMMPIVRQSKKNPKVFYHAGHGHLGWTLSPATAKQLCKIMETIKC
jgi:D-amino-acid dehydrogenase